MLRAGRCVLGALLLSVAVSCTGADDAASTPTSSAEFSSSVEVSTTAEPIAAPMDLEPAVTTSGPDHPAGVRLDCADPMEVDAPPDFLKVIGGALAMRTRGMSSEPLQLGRTVGTGSDALQFAKTGLTVRSGEQFEIVVVPTPGRTALVSWGNTGNNQPTERFMVGPCTTGSGWLSFPGGYWVSEPGCVSLIVRHQGIDENVRVAVGAPCDA
jgi:hypothetical protein